MASIARGHPHLQTLSGPASRPCSTGSSPSPSEATTPHRTPDQNQSRQRAVHHTSGGTVFACLNAGYQYTPRRPRFYPRAYCTTVWCSRQHWRCWRCGFMTGGQSPTPRRCVSPAAWPRSLWPSHGRCQTAVPHVC